MRNRPKLKVHLDSSRRARFRILMLLSDHHFRLVSTRRWYVLNSAEASASCFPCSVYRWFCMIYCMEAGVRKGTVFMSRMSQLIFKVRSAKIACISSGGHHNNWLAFCMTWQISCATHDSHPRAYFLAGQICLSVWIYNYGGDLLQRPMYVICI